MEAEKAPEIVQTAEISTSDNGSKNNSDERKTDTEDIMLTQAKKQDTQFETEEEVRTLPVIPSEETDLKNEESNPEQIAPPSTSKSESPQIQEHEEGEINISKKSFEDHPYKLLLLNFFPSNEQLSPVDKINVPKPIKETPLCEITNKDRLEQLLPDLKQQKELGIDLEYSDHGYKALTCLLQISTSEKDYILDTISLKNDMSLLQPILVDPNIVKIFHSSFNDLKWLQQDFGLFVVNMFDTQIAMQTLGYQKLGLDAILANYKVFKDKSMQRVDFRKRPLPPKYIDYARTDSHYLIPTYQKLKNELVAKNLLTKVFQDCNNACKVLYEKVEDQSYNSVVGDIKRMHCNQLKALEKLNDWRHKIAEYLDLNTGVVLSKNNMKNLVLAMTSDRNEIIRIGKSGHVKQHVDEIVGIMLQGKGERQFEAKLQFPKGRKRKFEPWKETNFDLRNRLQPEKPVFPNKNKRRWR